VTGSNPDPLVRVGILLVGKLAAFRMIFVLSSLE